MRKLALLAALSLVVCTAANGEVYKWTDKDGKVNYGDKPKSGKAETVAPKPGNLPGEPLDPEAEKAAAERAAACEARTKQLETYKAAAVIKQTDALGQTREFSPEERQKFIELTEKQVVEACAPPAPVAQ